MPLMLNNYFYYLNFIEMAEEELPEGFIYEPNEELDDIDYYEIVSLDEIIKLNPSFVAFSNEEIYNYLFNFLKSKSKANGFLNLFNDIIEKQKTPFNINNFIIIADAKRDDFSQLDIEDFISKIKNKLKKRGYETIQVNDKSILAFSEV